MKPHGSTPFGDLRPYVLYAYGPTKTDQAIFHYVPRLGSYSIPGPSTCAWMIPSQEVDNEEIDGT